MRPRRILVLALLLAPLLAPATARADDAGATTTTGAENINGATANPTRFLYQSSVCRTCVATDVTNNPRAQNLNPEGINFSDCEQNLRMDFSLAISGFSATDDASIQVWAGTIDCTQPLNRVVNGGATHPCWQVANPIGPMTTVTGKTITQSVYARDVLRYEQPPADPGVVQAYDPTYNYSSAGELACHVQPSDAAVPLSIFFVAVDSVGNTLGTAYQYSLTADLVAPPPPAVGTPSAGDTLLTVNWTSPGDDPDIIGFAVYSDPPSGSAVSNGCGCGPAPGSGAGPVSAEGGAGQDSGSGSVLQCTDAGADAGADAAPRCVMVNQGGTSGGATCASSNLSGHSSVVSSAGPTVDSGAPAEAGTADDASDDGGEAGDDAEAGTTAVTLTGGGISDIDSTYQSAEVDSPTTTSLQLVGLTNGVTYKIGVASLDGSGNIGPLSPLVCGVSGAVNDFFQTYKDDGGASGCALDAAGANVRAGSVFGLGLLAAAAALFRRRRGAR